MADSSSAQTSQPHKDNNLVVQIAKSVLRNDKERIQLDVNALRTVLMQEDVRDLPVAIYSVTEPTRTGKSFLLTLLMRHINRAKMAQKDEKSVDMEKLEHSFDWKGGFNCQTKGIYISKNPIFFHKDSERKQKVALFLMDTQGLFDHETAENDQKILGAWTFLLSSWQFYNVSEMVTNIHLDYICKFINLAGNYRKHDASSTIFELQALTFIIRNWEQTHFGLGFEGGKTYLANLLDDATIKRAHEHEMKREYLKETFKKIDCFVLEPPSAMVRQRKDETYFIKDIGEQFLSGCDKLFKSILAQDNMMVKKMHGREVTCQEFFERLAPMAKLVNEKNFEELGPHFILIDTLSCMKEVITRCMEEYVNQILEKAFQKDVRAYHRIGLIPVSTKLYEKALKQFDETPKTKIPSYVQRYKEGLSTWIRCINKALQSLFDAEDTYIDLMKNFQTKVKQYKGMQSPEEFERTAAKDLRLAQNEIKEKVDDKISDQVLSYFTPKASDMLDKALNRQKSIWEKVAHFSRLPFFKRAYRRIIHFLFGKGKAMFDEPILEFSEIGQGPLKGQKIEFLSALHGDNMKEVLNTMNEETHDHSGKYLKVTYSLSLKIDFDFGELEYPNISTTI